MGIGGAYMCVYGMEGPGGYQFVGRTLQMWNRWRDARHGAVEFEAGKPWLLRFFDQIRFYPVSEAELLQIRRDFPAGRHRLRIEPGSFGMHGYRQFLAQHADEIDAFKARQQTAFHDERERWRQAGQAEHIAEADSSAATVSDGDLPEGARSVFTQVPGSVWQVLVAEGDTVQAGDTVAVIESMKMEFPVVAPCAGRIARVACKEGSAVSAGQAVAVVLPEEAA